MRKDLLGRVLVLLQSCHTHLVLSALRFCRRIVGLQDEFYNQYVERGDHFAPVVALFQRNSNRYNLINSAIVEMFNFIINENVELLIVYSVRRFMDVFRDIAYVKTFEKLKVRYDQNEDKRKTADRRTDESMPAPVQKASRFRRDARDLDEDEEFWFNEEDEDDLDFDNGDESKSVNFSSFSLRDSTPLSPVKDRPLSPPLHAPGSPPLGSPPFTAGRKEFRSLPVSLKEQPQSPPSRPIVKPQTAGIKIKVNPLHCISGKLVDYPDEDSDEEESNLDCLADSDSQDGQSPAKKKRLA
ncbi:serine/threonine-protein phosphatase 4 regulatory subunit 3-like [Corticium candelabrum]|uniref:serine/threonine-protein phosphatase 4 regulatory subunit 3-like n=1 Tax=Corticium candelabrum TaxID=121492 RepID=UPI002E266EC5|nr:serine/threonine-protein phosphatase 4 regulatory subunit 3-like [Corticium candelabrum]